MMVSGGRHLKNSDSLLLTVTGLLGYKKPAI